MSHYLPFRPWITALFIVIAVAAPAIAWPSRGLEDAFIDRRDSLAISSLGHRSIENSFKSLGGDKGIAAHNAQLESLVSIEEIKKTGAQHGDSTSLSVTVLNNSNETVNSVLFIDKQPRALTETSTDNPFWIMSPRGWSAKPGSKSTFQMRTSASSIPEPGELAPYVVLQRIKGRDKLTGFWTSGRPSSVLYGRRISVQ